MIEDVNIDSDERGFSIRLDGDFWREIDTYNAGDGTLCLRLTQDSALRLLQQSIEQIGPWASEMARELVAYRQASPEERAAVLNLHPDDTEAVTEIIDPSDWPFLHEHALEAADIARKRAKGE